MEFSKQGKKLSSNAQLLLMSMRDPDRPKLDTATLDKIALSKPAHDLPLFQEKRGRGRPRKNTVESEIQIDLKENYILDIKENLKLLEIITNGYREIERIDKETQKNVKKLCALMHNAN